MSIDESGHLSDSMILGEGSNNAFAEKEISGFSIKAGRVSGSVENKSTIEGDGGYDSYSVSFDAPLKGLHSSAK
ncbi:MAG: hypothetical protein L0229_12450 [Blastocatellia bacterium]|nr:hypothetical protein [Blastocatellia bacterium]